MRDICRHVEDDVDARLACALRQPGRVVEEHLVGAHLQQEGRKPVMSAQTAGDSSG